MVADSLCARALRSCINAVLSTLETAAGALCARLCVGEVAVVGAAGIGENLRTAK